MKKESYINIEDFEKLNVVKKLKEIIGNWWQVQLNFTDEQGYLRGVPQGKFFSPTNAVCKFITENHDTFLECKNAARKATTDAQNTNHSILSTCHAGFSTLTVPIRVDEKYLGCIFADGFLIEQTAEDQKKNLKNYLKKLPLNDKENLDKYVDELPILSMKDVTYLKELLDVVIEEILSLKKDLFDSAEKFAAFSSDVAEQWQFEKIIGKSQAMQHVFHLLSKISDSEATILITGENGTGKEGIAKAIHFHSRRKDQSFVVQNCGAINDNLLESELFGHVKGSFTSAIKDKKGLFELADKGTLFLDEIGDTSQAMQVKLLRVLQEGTFIPVGGTEEIKTDVRILAATNKNLEEMVKNGTFREDLYYRLNVINIKLPALRERREDIPLLITQFLKDFASQNKTPIKKISSSCLSKMEKYDWPGNVRELQNEVERLCILAGSESEIHTNLLSERIYTPQENGKFPGIRLEGKLKDAIEELEKSMILNYLEMENWNKSKVALKLGISRASLIMKCEKYGFKKGT